MDREEVLRQAAVDFGRRVKKLRKDAGLTQADLAERLSQWGRSYHQTTVAKLESGTRPTSLEELIPLSVALGIPQQAFFQDPSPADQAEREARQAEQEVLRLRAELDEVRDQQRRLRRQLEQAEQTYAEKSAALRQIDPEVAADREEKLRAEDDERAALQAEQWPL